MNKLRVLIILALMLGLQAVAFANEAQVTATEEDEKVKVTETTQQKNLKFVLQLKNQLQNTRNDYFQVGKNIDEAKERLIQAGESIKSLKLQLGNFDYLISVAQAKIRNVEKQIAQKQNLIAKYREDIKFKQIELENQKILLRDYFKMLYIQENSFISRNGDANLSASKLLLGDATISDTFKRIEYLAILEQTGQNIFNRLDTIKDQYQVARNDLQQTRQKLAKLDLQLDEEKRTLKLQRHAKTLLYKQTKGEESIYRELIAQSKREQLGLAEEINKLRESLVFIAQKIEEDGENFDPDNYTSLIHPNVRAIYDFEMLDSFASGDKFNWPVNPTRGISAYFRDPSYLRAFGIPHSAIDIPIMQETPIRAPAAGVVYKVKDNDTTSYSYIILAHKGGLLTVYGHMYETLVDERDIVLPGEVIGLSGGIPGTTGAGYLTTGAHLHFEVMKNGKHIDPLYVLDLEKLDDDYIPAHLKDLDLLEEVDDEE